MPDETPEQQLRRVAASATGLHPDLASRLNGETIDELMADAAALRDALGGLAAPATDASTDPNAESLDGGTRRTTGGGDWTRESIAKLAKQDPHRFNDLVDRGEIDLARVLNLGG
jgi:hypothetical protein